jgi:hypothetical protein
MAAIALPSRSLLRSQVEAVLAGFVALATAIAILVVGPAPGDAPVHLYRTLLVQHGDLVWDNLWFDGVYPIASYSLLYYFPAAVVGNLSLLLASAALSAWLFARICFERWGNVAKWPIRLAGVLCAAPAFTGLYAYSLGLVAMLGALRTLQRGHLVSFGVLAALTLGFSPLAFLFLLLLLGASFAERPRLNRRAFVVAGIGLALVVVEAALLKLFPSGGTYPFNAADFVCLLALCACGATLARRQESGRVLVAFFVLWATAATFFFVFPSPIGDNVTRLRALVLPVMLITASLARFRPRWLAVLAIGGAFAYNLVPYFMLIPYRLDTRPQHESFWQPALAYLTRHESPNYRVEVVETAAHWESYWFPREGFPIVRGWYRQLDMEQNPVLYEKHETASAYRAWLHSVGVRYVVLPKTKLDPVDGVREARLLESKDSGLRVVLDAPTLTVLEVPNPTPILSGRSPARLTRVTPGTISGSVAAPGTYRLRIESTPYMDVRSGQVCLARAPGGQITLRAKAAGSFELAVPEDPFALLEGNAKSRCS